MGGDSTRENKWKMRIINFSHATPFSRKMNLKMYAARASDRIEHRTKRFDRKVIFQCFSPNRAYCLFIRGRYLAGSGISITSRKLIR